MDIAGYVAGRAVDWALSFGRIVAAATAGTRKSVFAAVRGVGDLDAHESAAIEAMFNGLGLYARPRSEVTADRATPLNPEGSCEVIAARFQDELIPIAYRDTRLYMRVDAEEGETGIVGYGGGFVSIRDCSDLKGSKIVIVAPTLKDDGTLDTKSYGIFLDPEGKSAGLVHGEGGAIWMTADSTVMKDASGNSFIELNKDQMKLTAQSFFFNSSQFVFRAYGEGAFSSALSISDDGLVLSHASGSSLYINSDGDLVFKHQGGGSLTFSGDGMFVSGNLKVNGTGMIGDIAALSEPALPNQTVIFGTSGQTGQPLTALYVSLAPPA